MATIIDRAEANFLMNRLERGNPALPIRAPDFDHLVGKFVAASFVIALRRVAPERLAQIVDAIEDRPAEIDALRGIAGSGDFSKQDRGGYAHREICALADAEIDVFEDRSARGVNWLYAMRVNIERLSELIEHIERNIQAIRAGKPMPHSRSDLVAVAHAALADCAWEEHTSAPRAAHLMARTLQVVNNDDPQTAKLALPRFVCDAAADEIAEFRLKADEIFSAIEHGAYAVFDAESDVVVVYGPSENGDIAPLYVAEIGPSDVDGAPAGVFARCERPVIDEGGVCAKLYTSLYCTEREYRAALPAFEEAYRRGETGWVVVSDCVVAYIPR